MADRPSFVERVDEKVIVFDGAMGTSVHARNPTLDDYAGLEGCTEILIETHPEWIREIHASFFEVGCDVVETDTFGANRIVLAEYDIADRAYDLNRLGASLAREVADGFTTPDHPRYVSGSIGPGTKLLSLGQVDFESLHGAYEEQVRGLLDGGVDLLQIETCQDILQAKTAVIAAFDAMKGAGREVPVIVQVTIETTGTMLVGSDIAAALTTLDPFPILAIGINCATGPEKMVEPIRYLAERSPKRISCLPNAGLPENVGGETVFPLKPDGLATYLRKFVTEYGVDMVGGCCGTTPAHLQAVVDAVGGAARAPRTPTFAPGCASLYVAAEFAQEPPPFLVGEQSNTNGSRRFKKLVETEDWDAAASMGKRVAGGAHALDLCAAYVGRDEKADMLELVTRFVTRVPAPLFVDSHEPHVVEAAFRRIAGRPVLNSVNLEDGTERFDALAGLAARFGAAVVAGTIDEEGMARAADRKVAIAKRIFERLSEVHGLRSQDVLFDLLTFPLTTGDEEQRPTAKATIEAIRRIKEEIPGCFTILGVSNVSFGIAPAARKILNSVFLHEAVDAGLDAAIIDARGIVPPRKIGEEELAAALRLIADDRSKGDPLTAFMKCFEGRDAAAKKARPAPVNVEERLHRLIVDGEQEGLIDALEEALRDRAPLAIVNEILLDGMKEVGELFGAGQMQLPFVLQSAEVMKAAVAHLEPKMDKADTAERGRVVLATVRGDVHDIGKNLVGILLRNNGYTVTDLGIKVPVERLIEAAEEVKPTAVGMSGLLVKSTVVMKENLEVFNERGIGLPVILGGAALNRRYVEEDLREIYKGDLYYAPDAFAGLGILHELAGVSKERRLTAHYARGAGTAGDGGGVSKAPAVGPPPRVRPKVAAPPVATDVPVPVPPFWGSRVVDRVDPASLPALINRTALYRGGWQFKRGKRSKEAYERFLREEVDPIFDRIARDCLAEGVLHPAAVYGYFPAQSEGDAIVVYEPPAGEPDGPPDPSGLRERLRIPFPRQRGGRELCIADFVRPVGSGEADVVAFQVVTVGEEATRKGRALHDADKYADYLYVHGFCVESTEALAELLHRRIREELGIAAVDAPEPEGWFRQRYRGARYSFGYPACPDLEGQRYLFDLLDPGRIGVGLTETFQLEPEQSTSAVVIHHPQAKYFNV